MADSPLQKVPFGVLGALDLKTLGLNPTLFGDRVQPVIEVFDNYLAPQVEVVNAIEAAAQALGDFAMLQIPAGECWRILGANAAVRLNTGTDTDDPLNLTVHVRPTQNVNASLRLFGESFGIIATMVGPAVFSCGGQVDRLLMPPGAQLYAQLDTAVSAASQLVVSALIQRIPV